MPNTIVSISNSTFNSVVANVYYRISDDSNITSDMMKDYGGTLTWIGYVITDPTCTTQGYTTFTYASSGESYTGDYVEALGHDMSD